MLHLLPPPRTYLKKYHTGQGGRKAPKDGGIKESKRRLLYARWVQAARIKFQKERSSKLISNVQSVGYCNSKDGTPFDSRMAGVMWSSPVTMVTGAMKRAHATEQWRTTVQNKKTPVTISPSFFPSLRARSESLQSPPAQAAISDPEKAGDPPKKESI